MTDTPFTLPELHLADADRGRSEEWFLPALDAFLRQGSRTILPRNEGMWEKIPGSAYHLEPELFLQLQGGCEVRFPRQTVLLRRGDLLLIPPGLPHAERSNNCDGTPFANFVLMTRSSHASLHLACAGRDHLPVVYHVLPLEEPPFYCGILQALSAWADHRDRRCEEIRDHLRRALLEKLRLDIELRLAGPRKGQTVHTVIESFHPLAHRAKRYIDENFPNRFPDVTETAHAIGCSPNYLSSLFLRAHGVTVKEYVNTLKFNYARRMLEESSYNVSEIAGSCGFSDVIYFSRQFRARFGYTPSQLRTRPADGVKFTEDKRIYKEHDS